MSKILIFFIFNDFLWAAKNSKHESIRISRNLKSGEYLIYNCKRKFFACVDQFSFDICRRDRESAIKERKGFLICAPIKKFDHYDNCTKAYYELIRQPIEKKFCWYQKLIN